MLMKYVHNFSMPNCKPKEGSVETDKAIPLATAIGNLYKYLSKELNAEIRAIKSEDVATRLRKPTEELAAIKAKKGKRTKGRPTKEAARHKKRRDALKAKKIDKLQKEIDELNEEMDSSSACEAFVSCMSVLICSNAYDYRGDGDGDVTIEGAVYMLSQAIGQIQNEIKLGELPPNVAGECSNLIYQLSAALDRAVVVGWDSEQSKQVEALKQMRAAIELSATTEKLRLHPHKLSIERVYEVVDPENCDINSQELSMGIHSIATKTRDKALRCSHITDLERAVNRYAQIENVDEVLSDVLADRVDNAFLSAPMGGVYNSVVNGVTYNSGSKTDGIMLPLAISALRAKKTMAVIVHRTSLAEDIYQRVRSEVTKTGSKFMLNSVFHYGRTTSPPEHGVLVVCVNSLHHFPDFMANADYVVVDECTQVMDNFSLIWGETGADAAFSINNILVNAITSKSTKFIGLDADLEVDYIQTMTRECDDDIESKAYVLYHPETSLPPAERSRQVTFYRNELKRTPINQHLIHLAEQRKLAKSRGTDTDRFCVAVDSRAFSADIASRCESLGLKVCLINSHETKSNENTMKLLSRKISPEDFDVVVMSPSITSGVSWTSPSFKRCVVICCGVIPASNMKQMAFRFRHTNQIDVFEASRRFNDDSLASKLKEPKHEYEHAQLLRDVMEHRKGKMEDSASNQLRYLYWQFDAEGWGCSAYDIEKEQPLMFQDDELDKWLAEDLNVFRNKVLSANDIPVMKYIKFKDIYNRTKKLEGDQLLQQLKFEHSVFDAVSFESDDIAFVQSTNNDRAIQLFLGGVLKRQGDNGDLFRKAMSILNLEEWETDLKLGKEISISREDAAMVVNAFVEDENYRNMLVDLELIGKKVRWVLKHGEPISTNIAIIIPTYPFWMGETAEDKYRNTMAALQLRLDDARGDYSMYKLESKNFLIKRNDVNRDSLSANMLSKIAKRCGINAKLNRNSVVIGGEKQAKTARIAHARSLVNRVVGIGDDSGQLKEAIIFTKWFSAFITGQNRVVFLGKKSVILELFSGDFEERCERKISACSPRQARAERLLIEAKSKKSFDVINNMASNANGDLIPDEELFSEDSEVGCFELNEQQQEFNGDIDGMFYKQVIKEMCCTILAQIPDLKDVELLLETTHKNPVSSEV